ncbi:MAG: hypothetical protein WBD95_24400 [Xanthobacteraceae bacterium]
MAKAHFMTESGTRVTIEGEAEEVATLIKRFDKATSTVPAPQKIYRTSQKAGPQDRILGLVAAGFFDRPQGLGAIRSALEEQGHFYPPTTLSPVLLRLVRNRSLRRIKEHNVWSYVKP